MNDNDTFSTASAKHSLSAFQSTPTATASLGGARSASTPPLQPTVYCPSARVDDCLSTLDAH